MDKMENTIIFASNNQGKILEMQEKLKKYGFQVVSQKDSGINIEVEETGTTFTENAILKAEKIHQLTGMPVIADDSGLKVDALNGEPGVYSHRFAGPEATDEDRSNKILELLKEVPEEKRTARFQCSICYIEENGEKHVFDGVVEGKIGQEPKGKNGFGFDPIFVYHNKTFEKMTREEKTKISHRGNAIHKFLEFLEEQNANRKNA